MTTNQIQAGKYKHYKGNEYLVVDVAKHSENLELMVIYRCLYDQYGLWVRPLDMFLETVNIEGVEQPRFKYLGDLQQADIDAMPAEIKAQVLAGL